MVFDMEYRELNELGWVPTFPRAMSLIWDSDTSKFRAFLYVIGSLQLIEVGTLLTLEMLARSAIWRRKTVVEIGVDIFLGGFGASLLPIMIVGMK